MNSSVLFCLVRLRAHRNLRKRCCRSCLSIHTHCDSNQQPHNKALHHDCLQQRVNLVVVPRLDARGQEYSGLGRGSTLRRWVARPGPAVSSLPAGQVQLNAQPGAAPDRPQCCRFSGSPALVIVGRNWRAAGELGRCAAACGVDVN